MRRISAVLAAGVAALCAVIVVSAQEAPPEEYVEAMQTIRGAMAAANAEGGPDLAAVSEAATAARDAFGYVQMFWLERGDDEAAQLAADGARIAASLAVSANLGSVEGVAFEAEQMGMTCGACHMAHRTRLEDGTFVIN